MFEYFHRTGLIKILNGYPDGTGLKFLFRNTYEKKIEQKIVSGLGCSEFKGAAEITHLNRAQLDFCSRHNLEMERTSGIPHSLHIYVVYATTYTIYHSATYTMYDIYVVYTTPPPHICGICHTLPPHIPYTILLSRIPCTTLPPFGCECTNIGSVMYAFVEIGTFGLICTHQ